MRKDSTRDVYARFDGHAGFDERRARVVAVATRATRARDLADLPPNDLGSRPLVARLQRLGAFRADVSGAGPTVYGLFVRRADAESAAAAVAAVARVWTTDPAWYG